MQTISTRGWTLDKLLARAGHFKSVPRVSCTAHDLEKVIEQYEEEDVPLVIEGWHQASDWPQDIFNIDFCRQHFRGEDKKISARNIHTRSDESMTFDDFVERSRTISAYVEPEETERWYGKDIECPLEWEKWLLNERVIPAKLAPEGSNDLLALRPKKNGRPDIETLMCYFGVADTYTPCHKDQCASSGQNLMCYTEKGGSSFWFMTKGSDCAKVSQYLHTLGQELDHEACVLSVSELVKAPFNVYVVEQKLGDLILVPPRSCHQVINSGGMTVKMSWSRMTLPGLTAALHYELPLYRRVCRPETYQIRSTIYYALCDYTQKLKALVTQPFDSIQRNLLAKRLTTVLRLYDRILLEEYSPYGDSLVFSKTGSKIQDEGESSTQCADLADDFQTCDFCGADIFQSYFQCSGNSASEAGFTICPGCYAEGRACACEEMDQKQRQKFSTLFAARWSAIKALKDTGNSVKSLRGSESLVEQKNYFAQMSDCSIFHAAMLLHHMRINQRQPLKACRAGYGDSHSVPSIWALGCKKCHSAKCFPHLLEVFRMHSVPALLLQEQDQSHAIYHSRHIGKFPEYDDRKERFLIAQKEGSPNSDFNVQLVYNASVFTVCQPINAAYASLGWYDQVPPKPAVDQYETQNTSGSPTNSSQKSVKNHAYVEVKHRVATAPSRTLPRQPSSSPLSSDHDNSDREDLLSNPQRMGSSLTPISQVPRRVQNEAPKREQNNTLPSDSHSTTRLHDSQTEPSGVGTIFATVYPVGPPRKKRRHESDLKSRSEKAEGKRKAEEPNGFAAALGAAINQVATTATRTSSGSAPEHRRKSDNIKKRPSVKPTTISPVADSSIQKKSLPEGPILVNVAELQDMVARTAERVVRQVIGETPLAASLMTKTAVSMMTGYATTGSFVNDNTQMQFPSVKHFAGVSSQMSGSAIKTSSSQGSASSHQRQIQPSMTNSMVHSKDGHQLSNDRSPSQTIRKPHDPRTGTRENLTYPLADRSPQRKRPTSPHSPNTATYSNEKRRRVLDEDEV